MCSRLSPVLMLLVIALVIAMGAGCQAMPAPSHERPNAGDAAARTADAVAPAAQALDLRAAPSLDAIMPRLASKRVVFVGETHDRLDHHLNQLEIIRRMYAAHPDLVIAMEYFQQPFQPYLDAYIGGSLDEKGMLQKTRYFDRWGFDYRLYRPILQFAREHSIPLLALNAPQEMRDKVAKVGVAGLDPKERAQIPKDIDRSDADYRKRLEAVFQHHPNAKSGNFERFVDVQLLWDETMAERAAQYLRAHTGSHMVLLAGTGHLAYGSGIPKRLTRRVPADTAIVLNEAPADLTPDMADFVLMTREQRLPPAGTMGVALANEANGVTVKEVNAGSPANAAGIKAGDRLLAIDGYPVSSFGDVKVALLGLSPGTQVRVKASRPELPGRRADKEFTVRLQ